MILLPDARAKAHLSVDTLALVAGLQPSYLRQIERGAIQPNIAEARALASALKTSLDDLRFPGEECVMSEATFPPASARNFGKNVREVRLRKGLHQVDVARDVGISRDTLRFIEEGVKVPRLDTAARIAAALCAPLDPEVFPSLLPPNTYYYPDRFRWGLNQARLDREISIPNLANSAGISKQSLYLITSGKTTPDLETAMQLAHVLRVPLDSLVFGVTTGARSETA